LRCMKIVREAVELGKLKGPVFVTLGNFDGLHLGHQKIIRELISRAREVKGLAVVVTFDPHPREVLNPGEPLFLMTTMDHRLRLFEQMGVDLIWVMRFDRDFANISAHAFVEELLFPNLKFRELIVGKNYVFGKNRQGNAELLRSLSQKLGFKADFVEPVETEGVVVSSSLIRKLIREGRLKEAERLLGRPYSVCGPVIHGSGIGAQIGFRTANVDSNGILLPPRGVYAVEVKWKNQAWVGVANIGVRPTVQELDTERLEVHILDFQTDIYDSVIEVVFMEKLREEVRFPDKTSLEKQIRKDVENVRMKFLTT
jgi:riboflavin kinase/FMN adenylyltransferase